MTLFSENRARFFAMLPNNSVALFCAAPMLIRNCDEEYPYRQDSDFYYLTGFTEADSIAVFIKDKFGVTKFILFNKSHDPEMEIWLGKVAGQKGAVETYGADEAFPFEEADSKIPDLLVNRTQVYYPFYRYKHMTKIVMAWLEATSQVVLARAKNSSNSFRLLGELRLYKNEVYVTAVDDLKNSSKLLSALRLFKSPLEIERMQRAAQVSAEAFVEIMRNCRAGMTELQIASMFRHNCAMQGCDELACGCVVAVGENACTLHHITNASVLKDGDLILLDAGSEYEYYAADISRTFPINGKFSPEQRAIYTIVLNAQKAGIAAVKPGGLWLDVMRVIDMTIAEGLVSLGILKGDPETLVKDRTFKEFYPHGYGHWLGIDIHDVGYMPSNEEDCERRFQPGMVLTVEPGIYIGSRQAVDPKWFGIGVRIEDDILVTKEGNEVLSKFVPKEIDEIEQLMERPMTRSSKRRIDLPEPATARPKGCP